MPFAFNLSSDIPRACALIFEYGWNAVAYQILNPGIYHWFSAEGDAVVGFVKRGRYLVVAGAPVCSACRLGQVAIEFEAAARAVNCSVCYFGAGERLYDNCKNPPEHTVITLGAQPVWFPADWPVMVKRRASIRAQICRAKNKGVVVAEWSAEDLRIEPQLRGCLDEWLASRRMPTMHFLVEPETLSLLEDRRIFVAERVTADGIVVVAFLVASPIPARNGWLIEQIIRSNGAPNGTNEALLDAAVRALAISGASYVTLGLVPLAKYALPASLVRNPLWLRLLLGWVRAHGRRFYNFEGLEAFKTKFDPVEWEPIFAITNERHFTPEVLYAIAAAFSHRASPMLHAGRTLAAAGREECHRLMNRF